MQNVSFAPPSVAKAYLKYLDSLYTAVEHVHGGDIPTPHWSADKDPFLFLEKDQVMVPVTTQDHSKFSLEKLAEKLQLGRYLNTLLSFGRKAHIEIVGVS